MSIRAVRFRRRILYAWLWRSQPLSPLKDEEKADKLYNRHQVTIETELIRVAWRDKVVMPTKEEVLV